MGRLNAAERLPRWALHLLLAAGTALVAGVTLASDDSSSTYSIFYFLVATCAFCFLGWIGAVAQGALIAAAYTGTLVLGHGMDGSHESRWLVFLLVLAVGAVFIGVLRFKHDRLVAQLGEVSRVDPVTGLLNARGLDETLVREIERAKRSGSRFSVSVAAVDGFLGHQTRYGDAEGDRVVLVAGQAIAQGKRAIDSAARLEEDHFAVIATYTDERGAEELAQRVRDIANEALAARGAMAMSLGIAAYPRHGDTPAALIAAARAALAEARSLGGNRTLIARASEHSIEGRMQGGSAEVVATS
ncbi:MAG: hypothetical protein QOK25_1987 [Thermoleophilaceae bacterium]|jgi:diguanylate cyclase (GGDEF)-like protein|nr:hypothetical protein [Thermoleophilaceae bacterium]